LNTLARNLIEDRAEFKKLSKENHDKILKVEIEKTLNAKCIADHEANIEAQAEAHDSEMAKLKEKFDEVSEILKLKKQSKRLLKLKGIEFKQLLIRFVNQRNASPLLPIAARS
jgi:hypothetical protein